VLSVGFVVLVAVEWVVLVVAIEFVVIAFVAARRMVLQFPSLAVACVLVQA
jgi:hypothetical protein